MIPFFGLDRQYANLREEILDVTDQVYKSGQVLNSEYTRKFEQAIAAKCNRSYALAVNSGTQGLIFAQQATLKNPPYTVLIPTVSYVATINSVLLNNFIPVFCDITNKGLIDLDSIDYKLDQEIGGIMYVNLFGNTVDWDRFQIQTQFFNNNMLIIEDAAQSFGASYKGVPSGKMGTVSVLSFDPTKNLANYGSGGMILTDDLNIYETCRGLRDNGKTGILYHEYPGTNSKMSESDCAQLLVKLNYFDSWQRRRAEIAAYYTEELYQYVDFPVTTEGTTHAWSKYVIQTHSRTSLQAYLSYSKIETRIHYEDALYDFGVGFPYADYGKNFYSETSRFTRECLSLPIYPELSDGEVETIAQTVKNYFL